MSALLRVTREEGLGSELRRGRFELSLVRHEHALSSDHRDDWVQAERVHNVFGNYRMQCSPCRI